jgi:RNA polymerase sigma-70 factor (ECF subfamily)
MSKTPHPTFESIYQKLALPLTKFVIKRIGGNPEAVDEILSETMIAAWKGYKTFKYKSSFFTWLCRISLNKIADYYRDQINERSRIVVPALKAMSLIESSDIAPEEKLALNELRDNVNRCLNLLPYEKRRLLWFRYYQDMGYEQIAKILGVSVRSVEGRLYRAKHDFAKVYSSRLLEEI